MIEKCPVCASRDFFEFLHIPRVPVLCNRLWDTYEEALAAPQGEVCLVFCRVCTHIFNQAFDSSLIQYDPAYENSLFFSPRFQRYAESLAVALIERYDLRGKTILEIGSGTGEFLQMLCEFGDNHGLGFDPSYEPAGEQVTGRRIEFTPGLFSRAHAKRDVDFVCCRHVLEHLDAPAELLDDVLLVGAPVFFEVPDALYTIRDLGVWDIIYEHISYFTSLSLVEIFKRSGFDVLRIDSAFGGQFLTVEAKPENGPIRSMIDDGVNRGDVETWLADFSEHYHQRLNFWGQKISKLGTGHHKTVVWGAGSKGVTFLNALPTRNLIEYIVDINPRKTGQYVPGTGQQVVLPEFLSEYRADCVIVMNANYQDEIQERVSQLGLTPELVVA